MLLPSLSCASSIPWLLLRLRLKLQLQAIPADDVKSVPSTKKMMRDKHEFTGDVNIPCKAYH
jgi:hypothetical protein